MKNQIKSFLNKLPYIKGLHKEVETYKKNSCFPPGHYYSPIVNVDEIKQNEDEIWKGIENSKMPEIDLRAEEQVALVKSFQKFYSELPFEDVSSEGFRYAYKNNMYSYTDGILLYSMIRHLEPKKIVEVGSGHSSALMLDVNNHFMNNKIQLTFVEPNPERLYSVITKEDKNSTKIYESMVQDVDPTVLTSLNAGDILFIDSTHISKAGSDVNHILFEILPKLKTGVFIHFHDIFYPFEYPKDWVYGGRNWNENYILRAFLANNTNYNIRLFSHYLHLHHADAFKDMPLAYNNFGGNLWLEKVN